MLSEEFIRFLAELINGDVQGLYSYKTGSKLVRFFNSYFDYKDTYHQGFPSRWIYTYNKIVEIYNKNSINKLFNIILDKKYIMRDLQFSEEEAIKRVDKIVSCINEKAVLDDCYIIKKNNEYRLVNKDEDLEWIGGGGFADIYFQKSTGKVIKKLKEDFMLDEGIKSRFRREFRITKSLNDLDGVIKVYDFNDNDYSYTMEKAERSLEDYIQNNFITENQKINCIYQILNVMEEVHERKDIHRDISPNNILILNGLLKISDFGLGKDLNVFNSHQTIHTNAVGQYLYCAPEQFMLLKDGDFRSDVFSLGRVINFIMTKNPLKVNHILRNVTEKATSENSAFRYANAGELYKAVKRGIKFHNDATSIQNIIKKIEDKGFDENVEEYIYEQSEENLLNNIVNVSNFNDAVIKFMNIDEKHANFIIESITDKYQSFYRNFEEYDKLADIMFSVVLGNYSFPVKELAADILRYVAYYVNRFKAQNLINRAVQQGIDPVLEEILSS